MGKTLLLALIMGLTALQGGALAQDVAAPKPGTRLAMTIGGRTLQRETDDGTQWAYQWPAVYFEARFRGDAVALRFDGSDSAYNVLVDDKQAKVVGHPGKSEVVMSGLGRGAHTIRLEKQSETTGSVDHFAGFFVAAPADALPAPPPRPRRMEFIGDSYTAGYGNASPSVQCTVKERFDTTDSQQAFGPLAARYFHADYRVEAFSGIGLVRNYGNGQWALGHLPDILQHVLIDDPAPPDPWDPQVVVIFIGINDFSPPGAKESWPNREAMAADYEAALAGLVQKQRSLHPQALVVLAFSDLYPAGWGASVRRVVDRLRADGATKVEPLVFPANEGTGCDGHPNLRDHARMAGLLEGLVEKHPEIWPRR